MKCYIIAGEASGDLHGSNLMKALKEQLPEIQFRGFGGDLMAEQGLNLVKHIDDLAFMGFAEVIMNLRTILRNIKNCKKDIEATKPDMLVLIDYPGFNLRMATFAKSLGIQVYYYISPQIWAWKSGRVHNIIRDTDEVYSILPFEQEFYQGFGYDVEYVGHPLLDALPPYTELDANMEHHSIALLPGSRKQEVGTMLPLMLQVKQDYPEYRFLIAKAPSIPAEMYAPYLDERVQLYEEGTYALMEEVDAALVTSGTATLETALMGVPQVVCYKGNRISYEIAKRIIKVKYISLVNLIMDEEVVRELIQGEVTACNIKTELCSLLDRNAKGRAKMLDKYKQLRTVLGGKGASSRCAALMLKKWGDSQS